MSFKDIIVGDYGQVMKLTVIDVDTDAAADISDYSSTIQMIFTDPSGNQTTKTASFSSGGTDGVIQYTIESDLIDEAGKWKVRARVQGTGKKLTSTEHVFEVLS
jgi:hypothetical protein